MGTLLFRDGFISHEQLSKAKELACKEKNITIEEALVHLGFVLQDVVDTYTTMQRLANKGYSRKSSSIVQKIMQLASDHTDRYGKVIDNFTMSLSQK